MTDLRQYLGLSSDVQICEKRGKMILKFVFRLILISAKIYDFLKVGIRILRPWAEFQQF
jgi:hypothetical protein